METFKIVTLSISGLLLLSVGILRLANPLKTYLKNSGITLADDVNLLNEVRGVSALMMCVGVLILLGIAYPQVTFTSFTIATLFFLGFSIGRIFSVIKDGKPNKLIIQGLFSELILGTLNLYCLFVA